jgi:Predicted membrane protein involved in D-alanine export
MVFSSLVFLFRFMPAVFLLYYLVPAKWRNGLLAAASIFFYIWGELKFLPLMLYSTILDYSCGRAIEASGENLLRRKIALAFSLVGNLGALFFFKYADFFIQNLNSLFGSTIPALGLALPLGISFYTFQTMAYTIDVYRRTVPAEHNFIDYTAFVTLFPQLVAGPIVKYTDVNRELKHRTLELPQIQAGIFTFIMGLGSKVLLANNLGTLWASVQASGIDRISTPLAWMGIIAYSLQIYFDFSGYSLMAIGLGAMLGFHFPQNFNYPYISRSITEFWRRWHMTLGSWFREYVYIPLGGNRVRPARQYFNIFVVWALTGLWHGASWNFVCWGLYFCVLLCIEKAFLLPYLTQSKVVSRIYTLLLVVVSWVLFSLTDFALITQFLHRMFVFAPGSDWIYALRNYALTFLLAVIFATPLPAKLRERLGRWRVPVCTLFAAAVFLLSVAWLVDSTTNFFLYFRF